MDGVPRQVEPAALPNGAARHGLAGGFEAGMIVGGDDFDATHPAPDQTFEKGSPVTFGRRAGRRSAENAAATVQTDGARGQHGSVTHDTALACLLVSWRPGRDGGFRRAFGSARLRVRHRAIRRPADLQR